MTRPVTPERTDVPDFKVVTWPEDRDGRTAYYGAMAAYAKPEPNFRYEPTEEELKLIRQYIVWEARDFYLPRYAEQIIEKRGIEGGHNTLIFEKFRDAPDGWRFRRLTWTMGSWPIHDTTTLFECIDHAVMEHRSESWLKFLDAQK